MMRSSLRTLAAALAAAATTLAVAGTAGALPHSSDPIANREFYNAAYGQQQIGLVANPKHTVMVIGDSISTGAGRPAEKFGSSVPYVSAFTSLGYNIRSRAISGGTIENHLTIGGWSNPAWARSDAATPSFKLASQGAGVDAVYVELGTNDVGCLHPYESECGWSVPPDAPAGYPTSPPKAGTSAYIKWSTDQKNLIMLYTRGAVGQLIDAGKCVVWAGPRSFENYKNAADKAAGRLWKDNRNNSIFKDDVLWYNAFLKGLESEAFTKGKFRYADWDTYTKTSQALKDNFKDGSDQIHLNDPDPFNPPAEGSTPAPARQAAAAFATIATIGSCYPNG